MRKMFGLPKILKKIFLSGLLLVFLFVSFTAPAYAQTCTPASKNGDACTDSGGKNGACACSNAARGQVICSCNTSKTPAAGSPAAGGTWYNSSFDEWYNKVYTGNETAIFGERYTAAQVQWVIYGLFAFIMNNVSGNSEAISCVVGSDPKACLEKKFPNVDPKKIQTPKPADLFSQLREERPISAVAYVKDIGKHLKLVPDAQAQGFGFQALQNPVLEMWKAVRDITYSLFVLGIIILAFMIMFKVKLNPQTAVTVQSALPKVVIALILITFSYAIAGFLIDLMYVVIALISVLGSRLLLGLDPVYIFTYLTKGPAVLASQVVTGIALPIGPVIYTGVFGLFILYLFFFTICFALVFLGTFGSVVGALTVVLSLVGLIAAGSTGIGLIIEVIAVIIVIIILFIMMAKTLWALFMAYAKVVLLTIFAPIQILLGIFIPNMGFGSWIRNFVAQLAVFITVGSLFLMSFVFMIQGVLASAPKNWGDTLLAILAGPAITSTISGSFAGWPPLLGIGTDSIAGFLFLGVSFVIFTIIPKSAKLIESFIKGQPFGYGAAISEALGPATGVAGFGLGIAQKGVTDFGAKQLTGEAERIWAKYKSGGSSAPPPAAQPGSVGGGPGATP